MVIADCLSEYVQLQRRQVLDTNCSPEWTGTYLSCKKLYHCNRKTTQHLTFLFIPRSTPSTKGFTDVIAALLAIRFYSIQEILEESLPSVNHSRLCFGRMRRLHDSTGTLHHVILDVRMQWCKCPSSPILGWKPEFKLNNKFLLGRKLLRSSTIKK